MAERRLNKLALDRGPEKLTEGISTIDRPERLDAFLQSFYIDSDREGFG